MFFVYNLNIKIIVLKVEVLTMLDELTIRMQYEPTVLLFGKNYKNITKSVLDYSWNCIVTTNCDIELAAVLDNTKRMISDIMNIKDIKSNIMNKKNLHIMRLFGEKYPEGEIDDLCMEDITDNAVEMLSIVSKAIKYKGIILIENFDEEYMSSKEIRKAFKNLYNDQKQIYIFNCKNKNKYLDDLENNGIAVLVKQSINEFFLEYFFQDNEFEYEDETYSDYINFYVDAEKNASLSRINKKYLLETESFATLLNLELINKFKIPNNMYKDYFYIFLKNSIGEPQWFGFNYGFNIHRKYEDELYNYVKIGLETAGKIDSKPLLLVGQTGTGKSIALASVAHKIFNEKKYPVVYINNPDINFFTFSEYKNGSVEKKHSTLFNALDSLLVKIEDLGAKAILLVWDTSSYSSDREKCFKLYRALLSRGRKVFLLCTAYELGKQNNTKEMYESNIGINLIKKNFIECKATLKVSDELMQLRDILINKCKMNESDTEKIIEYSRQSNNYLSMLYYMFDSIRYNLSQGVYKEATANIKYLDNIIEQGLNENNALNLPFKELFKEREDDLVKAGLIGRIDDIDDSDKKNMQLAIEDFVKCIAVCSQFKLNMPYDYAFRILGTYNSKIIQELANSTFFNVTEDNNGNFEISIRTPLEAKLYMYAKGMLPEDEVECVIKMIEYMKPSSEYGGYNEVALCEKLVRIMGPNNEENRPKYKRYYDRIIDTLKNLRENSNIWELILISQELTYLRECYGNNNSLDIENRIGALVKAVKIAREVIESSEFANRTTQVGVINAISVECANSKILLYQLKESKDPLLYKEIRRDLRRVISLDKDNYHAYVTLLKCFVIEYKNERDEIKKLELLESMCTVIDELTIENPDVEDSEYFQRKVTEIYSYLSEEDKINEYLDELVNNGSAAGLYIICKKNLLENNVDFRKTINDKKQLIACENVYNLLNNEKYKSVIEYSQSCQYMLLNILWIMNNKEPMYKEGEHWITRISEDVWRKLSVISNNFIYRFSDENEEQPLIRNVKYIGALCLGELKRYNESISLLRSIEEDTTLGRKRVFTRHMLCEENGTIRTFVGRLGKYDVVKRSGVIYIDEFGKTPIYFYGPHMRVSNLHEGRVFTDIQIGYSIIGLKAFRQIDEKE